MTENVCFLSLMLWIVGFLTFYNDTKQFYKLNECEKNTDAHLRSLHSYNLNSDVSESTLILSRVGAVFNYSCDYNICQAHRDTLGIYWQRSNRNGCKHPLHGSSKRKADRGISLKRSVEIFLFWGEHVPIGSGICRGCREDHSKELSKFTFCDEDNEETNIEDVEHVEDKSMEGSEGLPRSKENCTKAEHIGLDPTSTKEVTLFLYRTSQHLKFDIKGHISFQSDVVNHCSTYALSDNKEKDFSGKCQHEHDNSCSVCSAVLQCESKVTDLYKEIQDNIPSEQKEEIEHDLEMSGKQISAWHSHCIRTVHQDTAKQDILSNLNQMRF
ncbi:unnamed protein product [Mytilus coruscus]|uniref:Uncharacterized protein n=1 Tax=Mytilus coruscus TaxID=42192 RepID=A0A6J8EGT7_MYTCO|nr:unnamed protein product [Mytilus coruscus]